MSDEEKYNNHHIFYQKRRAQEREEDLAEFSIMLKEGHREPIICKHFICGKELSLRESLFGDKCINHSIIIMERIYNAIILNEPYATKVKEGEKTIETRMKLLTKLFGDIIICCDGGKSASSKNAGKAICLVKAESGRPMTDEDEKGACIENVPGRIAYPLSDLRHFSYDFKFTDYAESTNWQGIFKIKLPDFVEIKPKTI